MRFCGVCGAALEQASAYAARDASKAERRHMTVMLCDVVESTPLAELLDPEDFREVLSGYQEACAGAIEGFRGYVARYIGDGVLAYFGYPVAHEDDPQRAVHAALGILDGVDALNTRLRERFDVSLQVRVGLHTGVVVAGEVGGGQAYEELAIVGEAPHVAARLQALAPAGSVVVGDSTWELVADQFETEPLGMRNLKGISRPVAVYRVVRATGSTYRHEPGRARKPIIDRTDELAELERAWQQAERGGGVLVHIAGEAGIGKSRLLRALREQVSEHPSAERVLHCSPHHPSTALHPVVRFLQQTMELETMETPERQLRALRRTVEASGLDPLEAVPLLADLLSIRGGEGATRTLMPRDARNTTLQILEALLFRDAARHPLLLVVEDLHWADPTTLELLERILTNLPGTAAACAFTFRRGFEPPWANSANAVEIELGPLASEDVRKMAATSGPTQLDPDTLRRVEAAADGVPLFIEEMVKMLGDSARAAAQTPGSPKSVVPPTLQGLLAERLDRLPGLAEVIDAAAVLGRGFEHTSLEALTQLDAGALRSAIAQLAAEEVLRPTEGSRTRLEFTHALLQEAAYERLLRSRRRVLHGRVADLLLARRGLPVESEPELIAHHLSCAARPAEALPYWNLAGVQALKRAAFQEAAEHFRRALESLGEAHPGADGDRERGELLTHLGAVLQAGRTPAASVEVIYADARSAFERAGRQERLVPVIRGQWLFHLIRAEYAAALVLAEEMLARGEHGGRGVYLAEGYLYRGLAHMYTGALDRARLDLQEAFHLHEPPERPDDIYSAQGDTGAAALAYLALLLWNQGHVKEALERSELSVEMAGRLGGPVTLAQAWGMRSGLLLARGELVELNPWLEKTYTHSAERNIGYWTSVCSLWSAWLRGRAGELDLGTRLLQEHLDEYLESGGRLAVPHFYILLADLLLADGDSQRAVAALRTGQRHIQTSGERLSEPELQWFLGRALMAGEEQDPAAATAAYQRSVDSAKEQGANLLELRALTYLGLHQRNIGAPCTTLPRLQSLCSWFGPEGQAPDIVRARMLLAGEATLR